MFHACVTRFDVTENLEIFLGFHGELNKASVCGTLECGMESILVALPCSKVVERERERDGEILWHASYSFHQVYLEALPFRLSSPLRSTPPHRRALSSSADASTGAARAASLMLSLLSKSTPKSRGKSEHMIPCCCCSFPLLLTIIPTPPIPIGAVFIQVDSHL